MTDPDRLREALEQYDEGIAGTHQVSELAAAARSYLRILKADDQVVEGLMWRAYWCDTHKEVTDSPISDDCKLIDTAPALWFGPSDLPRAVLARLGGTMSNQRREPND